MESIAIIIVTVVVLYVFWSSIKTLAKGLGFTTNEIIGSGSARVIMQCRKVNKATEQEWESEGLAHVATGDELLNRMMKSSAEAKQAS
mgnify:FL=1